MLKTALQQIPLDKVVCPKQIREHCVGESVADLATSLLKCGQLQPIRVRQNGDTFLLIIGGRRVAAARKAGFTMIAAIVEERELTETEILQQQFVENVQREDLTPIEKARAIDRLMKETGWTASETAVQTGQSTSTVSRLLAVLSLPEPIQAEVDADRIPLSAASELAGVEDVGRQAELAQQLVEGTLTRDGLSGTLKSERKATEKPHRRSRPTRVTAVFGGGRSVTMTAPGLSLESFIALLQDLLERARKVRPQGIELSTFIKMLRDQNHA